MKTDRLSDNVIGLSLAVTVACLVLQWIFPWWIIVLPAGVAGMVSRRWQVGLFSGILGSLTAWGVMILLRYPGGGEVLAGRITAMFGLPNSLLLLLITLLIPSILGGLAGLTGYQLKKLVCSRC